MINELYGLTEALDKAGIVTEYTHAKYKRIPRVSRKAPCIHIIFDRGNVYQVEKIEMEQAAEIRKYGSNQGTFPALNLAPLYRLTDESENRDSVGNADLVLSWKRRKKQGRRLWNVICGFR